MRNQNTTGYQSEGARTRRKQVLLGNEYPVSAPEDIEGMSEGVHDSGTSSDTDVVLFSNAYGNPPPDDDKDPSATSFSDEKEYNRLQHEKAREIQKKKPPQQPSPRTHQLVTQPTRKSSYKYGQRKYIINLLNNYLKNNATQQVLMQQQEQPLKHDNHICRSLKQVQFQRQEDAPNAKGTSPQSPSPSHKPPTPPTSENAPSSTYHQTDDKNASQ